MKVESGDITVIPKEGVMAVRSHHRRPEEERGNLDQMNGGTGSPWEPGTGRFESKSRIGIIEEEHRQELEELSVRASKSRRI